MIGCLRFGLLLATTVAVTGCGGSSSQQPPATTAPRTAQQDVPSVSATEVPPGSAKTEQSPVPPIVLAEETKPAPQPPWQGLADLVAEGKRREFELAPIDEARAAAAGLRKVTGKHLELWTDLPKENVAVDQLPAELDAAVQQFANYFALDAATIDAWRVRGYVIAERGPFEAVGLLPATLPEFRNGFARGSEFWLYDQPSDYYRRHLLFHEAVHALTNRMLGGSGPPWYMEGIAEYLATHRFEGDKIITAAMPRTRDEVPMWGRTKIIRDGFAAGQGMSLEQIFRYDGSAHLRNEPYGWCWGAASFLDNHPLTREKFRALKSQTTDRTLEFSERLEAALASDWPQITTDWQLFVIDCDYGYDFARSAILVRDSMPLPLEGATVSIAADRGYQSSGYLLEAGREYEITATGQFQVGVDRGETKDTPWISEPDGISLEYHRHAPLGRLTAAVCDLEKSAGGVTPLADPQSIGSRAIYVPKTSGALFFSINEASSGLADNKGSIEVTIKAK